MLTYNTDNTLKILTFLRTQGFHFPRAYGFPRESRGAQYAPRRTFVRKEAAHSGDWRWTLVEPPAVRTHWGYGTDRDANDYLTFRGREGLFLFGSKHRAMDLGRAIKAGRVRIEVKDPIAGLTAVELIEDEPPETFAETLGSPDGLEEWLALGADYFK